MWFTPLILIEVLIHKIFAGYYFYQKENGALNNLGSFGFLEITKYDKVSNISKPSNLWSYQ